MSSYFIRSAAGLCRIIGLGLILSPFAWTAPDQAFQVVSVNGNVTYRAEGTTLKEPVATGAALHPGGRILMEENGRLTLKTPANDEIALRGKTYLRLSTLAENQGKTEMEIDLYLGKSRCKVHELKKDSFFQMKTPVAVVGVRGTDFDCQVSEAGTTTVMVITGDVAVQDAGGQFAATSVGAGQMAQVQSDGQVKVQQMPPRLQEQLQKEADKKPAEKKEAAAKKEEKKEGGEKKADGKAEEKKADEGGAAPATGAGATTGAATESEAVAEQGAAAAGEAPSAGEADSAAMDLDLADGFAEGMEESFTETLGDINLDDIISDILDAVQEQIVQQQQEEETQMLDEKAETQEADILFDIENIQR